MSGTKVIIEQFGTGYAVETIVAPRNPCEASFSIRSVHSDIREAIRSFVYHFGMFDYQILSASELIQRDRARNEAAKRIETE